MSIIHLHDVKVTMITNKTVWYLFLFLTWIQLSLTFILSSLLLSWVQPPQVQPSTTMAHHVKARMQFEQLGYSNFYLAACLVLDFDAKVLILVHSASFGYRSSLPTPWPVMMLEEADLLSSPRPSRRSASQTLNAGETLSESDNRLRLEMMAQ